MLQQEAFQAVAHPGVPDSESAHQSALQIYCFGDFRLYRYGQLVPEAEWKRKRARGLCAYLVFHHGQFVPREQLIETFWPEADWATGLRNFAVVLHTLRRILEPGLQRSQQSRYLVREHEGYRFDPNGELENDVQRFLRFFEDAKRHHRAGQRCQAAQAFLNMIKLYRGAYLSNDPYEEWCIAPRQHFRSVYIEALLYLADYAFQQGDYRQSIYWLDQGLLADNCHEELHQRRILAYQQLDLYNEALRCYHTYCEVMEEELDSSPSPHMRVVYDQLRTICPSAYRELSAQGAREYGSENERGGGQRGS
jgi:DNA-binding SARP family transcriptional activator